MNNILDIIAEILDFTAEMLDVPCLLGLLPDKPDKLIALFEYPGAPPLHSFGATDYSYNVQARTRANTAAEAYALAVTVQNKLNRYSDAQLAIRQTTLIIDIGQDSHNPPRSEYTVNFNIAMKG